MDIIFAICTFKTVYYIFYLFTLTFFNFYNTSNSKETNADDNSEETNADDDYSILVIKVDDDEEETNEPHNEQINEEKQKKDQPRNENLLFKQENERIRNEILLLKQENERIRCDSLLIKQENERIRCDSLLIKQKNERIRNDNFLLKREINLLCQQIIQKDEIYKGLQDKMCQVQLNFQSTIAEKFKDLKKSKKINKTLLQTLKNKIGECINNEKKIANQQKLIDNFEEKIELVEISNPNKEKIIVNLIRIIRRIKKNNHH